MLRILTAIFSSLMIILIPIFSVEAQSITKCSNTQTPCWPTAGRPTTGPGAFGYNTTTNAFEGWNGTNWGFPVASPSPINFTGNINYNNSVADQTKSWLWQGGGLLSGIINGNNVDAFNSPYHIFFSDIADAHTSSNDALDHFSINTAIGTGAMGTRQVLQTKLNVTQPITYPGGDTTSNWNYTSNTAITGVTSNMGGIGGGTLTSPNWRGSVFASNSNIFTTSGATFLRHLVGNETDVTLVPGSSAGLKIGQLIQLGHFDAVRGNFDDSAIQIGKIVNTDPGTWHYGVSFGGYANGWAFSTDSTLIYAQPQIFGAPLTMNAKYGIDFSNVIFQATNSAPLRMPLATPVNSAEACEVGAMRWDASFIYVCTAPGGPWKRATLNAF